MRHAAASLRSFIILAVWGAALSVTAAAEMPGSLTTYLRPQSFNALVIDNERGWIDYVDPVMYDADIERAPVFKVRPRSPDFKLEGTDCSFANLRCVELHLQNDGKTLLAFKPGVAGDSYTVRGIKFVVRSVATLPASPQRKVHWVEFTAPAPFKSGDFVYVDNVGIVRFASAYEADLQRIGGAQRLSSFHLIDGPGLLSPSGFPKAR